MKKFIVIVMLVALLVSVLALTSCGNKKMFDTNYTFNVAYITGVSVDGGVTMVEVQSWQEFEDSQLQIIAVDGTIYYVNSVNCTLVYEE